MSNYQVIYKGVLHDGQGYAVAARGYLLALDKIGVDVVAMPVNFGSPPVKLPRDKYERIFELSDKQVDQNKKKVLVYHMQPWLIKEEIGKYDYIINNVVYEPDRIINEWVEIYKHIDQVWVPSKHNYDIFIKSGVEIPVHVFPHGVDDIFEPNGESIDFGVFNDKFKFLTVATWSYRKGLPVLLKAFWEEFTDRDNVCLILRTHSIVGETMEHIFHKIKELKRNTMGDKETAKIFVLCDYLSDEYMVKLYNTCDCYVLPTRGEGEGLPFMEAMACGKPVISTGWGGQMDFLNIDNSYLINHTMKPVDVSDVDAGLYFRDYMKLAEPDLEHLKILMRHVYENKQEAVEKGKRAMNDISAYKWEASALKMKQVLDRLVVEEGR